jgi:tetratricopeptide (TPR) repeat protein
VLAVKLWRPRLWLADGGGRLFQWARSEGRLAVCVIVLALAGAAVLAYFNQWTFVVFLALGWLPFAAWRARQHILIEEVADRTSGDPITNGAATLLTVELAQIQDVFRVVDERNAFPTAVGQQEPLEAAMKVDDFQENLRSSVTSESQLSVGGITIPLRPLMEILGRLVQGPRLRSELHEEGHGREQANRLVLTAQLTGFRRKGTWRIEHELAAGATRPDQLRALHEMVGELASRIFTDICLERKVRWRAMKNFLEALRTFRACLRTPRDRAFNLKEAESHLLQALAEDEDFVLVYYNLGVVYSELRTVAAAHGQPAEAARHLDSAEAAFKQAIEQDPGRWNAYYALARTHYERAQIARKQYECAQADADRSDLLKKERGHLRFARDLCERVSTMQAGKKTKADRAKAKDLVAFTYRLDEDADTRLRHRREAYKLSLKALSQTRRKTASRGGEDDPLPALTDLAANCIVNLATDEAGALRTAHDLRRSRVPALFALAQRLTSKEGRLHFELGRIALQCGDHERARTELGEATRIEPGAARYWAYLASAYERSGTACGQRPAEALKGRREDWYVRAHDACATALEKADLLYGPEEEDIEAATVVGATYDRLAKAYDGIDPSKRDSFKSESERLKRMQDFRAELEKLKDEDADALARLADDFHEQNRHWEAAHVAIIAGKKELDQGEPARAVRHFDRAQKWFGAKYPAELARRGVRGRRALAIAKQQPPAGDETLLGALRMAEEAVSVEPLSAFERKLLGEVYASLGDLERARTAWDEALLWSPNDPELHERLGRHVYWRLAEESTDRGKRAEYLVTAEQFLDRAIRLYGNDQYDDRRRVLFWLAKVAAAQGKYDDVIRRLRVLQRAPGWEPIAALNLGEAYFRTGRFDEAEPLFREAMAAPKEKTASNGAVMRELGEAWDAETLPLRAACWLVRSLTERSADLKKAGAELEKVADQSRRVLEQHPELKAALHTSAGGSLGVRASSPRRGGSSSGRSTFSPTPRPTWSTHGRSTPSRRRRRTRTGRRSWRSRGSTARSSGRPTSGASALRTSTSSSRSSTASRRADPPRPAESGRRS